MRVRTILEMIQSRQHMALRAAWVRFSVQSLQRWRHYCMINGCSNPSIVPLQGSLTPALCSDIRVCCINTSCPSNLLHSRQSCYSQATLISLSSDVINASYCTHMPYRNARANTAALFHVQHAPDPEQMHSYNVLLLRDSGSQTPVLQQLSAITHTQIGRDVSCWS